MLLGVGDGDKLQTVGIIALIAHHCVQQHGGAFVNLGQFDFYLFAGTDAMGQNYSYTRLANVFGLAGQSILTFDHADFRVPDAALMSPGCDVVSDGAILNNSTAKI
jgi:hypothetical protein